MAPFQNPKTVEGFDRFRSIRTYRNVLRTPIMLLVLRLLAATGAPKTGLMFMLLRCCLYWQPECRRGVLEYVVVQTELRHCKLETPKAAQLSPALLCAAIRLANMSLS